MKNYFNISQCIEKNECENSNSTLCDTCNRNSRVLKDNFKSKRIKFIYKDKEDEVE